MKEIELIIKIPEEIRLALINNVQLSIDQQSICDSCIKQAIINGTLLLKQESILDEIRSEIEKVVWDDVVVSFDGTEEIRIPRLDPDDVFEIIDKYKAESEVENGN